MMDNGRLQGHDGLLKEDTGSIMTSFRRTTAFLRRAQPVVMTLVVALAVLMIAILTILIRHDSESHQSQELQADQVFAQYGAPPEHGQEWTCSNFVSNIQMLGRFVHLPLYSVGMDLDPGT